MSDLDDAPIARQELTVPLSSYARPRRDAPPVALVAAVLLAILAGAAAWYLLRRDAAPPRSAPRAPAAAEALPAAPPAAAAEPLPTLDASDAFVRAEAARLSADPRFVRWLAGDALLRRAAAVVAALDAGTVPTDQLAFLRPAGSFEVRRSGGRAVVAEASYRRWDGAAEVFAALDSALVARLHRRLAPLLEQAWREVGDPALDFDTALARALAPLLAAEIPDAAPEVVADGAVYRYSRPDLEALTAAQKQLLRLGPVNARRVQDKLRELAAALALPAS